MNKDVYTSFGGADPVIHVMQVAIEKITSLVDFLKNEQAYMDAPLNNVFGEYTREKAERFIEQCKGDFDRTIKDVLTDALVIVSSHNSAILAGVKFTFSINKDIARLIYIGVEHFRWMLWKISDPYAVSSNSNTYRTNRCDNAIEESLRATNAPSIEAMLGTPLAIIPKVLRSRDGIVSYVSVIRSVNISKKRQKIRDGIAEKAATGAQKKSETEDSEEPGLVSIDIGGGRKFSYSSPKLSAKNVLFICHRLASSIKTQDDA